ncbi:hypothetical protein Hsc_1506 [Herbaspirillum seropedicae]|nr:hypothetical protein Hsc_1506 [Herbaspirillum seropedicae]
MISPEPSSLLPSSIGGSFLPGGIFPTFPRPSFGYCGGCQESDTFHVCMKNGASSREEATTRPSSAASSSAFRTTLNLLENDNPLNHRCSCGARFAWTTRSTDSVMSININGSR